MNLIDSLKGRSLAVVLLLIIVVALVLRLIYMLNIAPWTDEYYTMLHTRMVLERGMPIMPSGLFIRHGMLHAYAGALVSWLIGFDLTAVRLPSLIVSLPTLLLIYHVGQHWFNRRVGLLAALLLALSPEAITWGGQARMYVLWQFCTLAAVYLLYEGLLKDRSTSARVWGLLALTGAMLCQVRTLLTIPSLIAGLLAAWWLNRRGGSRLWRPSRIPWPELAALIVLVATTASFFVFERRTPVSSHAQINPLNWIKPARLFADLLIGSQQFVIPPYLFLTVFALAGGIIVFLRLIRRRPASHDPELVFLYVILIVTVIEFSLFSAQNIRIPRYLFDMLPFYCLIVVYHLDYIATEVQTRLQGVARTTVGLLPALLIVILFARPALLAVTTQRSAAQPALEYVRDHWQPGDRIATRLPALPYLVLGRCDYFVALNNPFLWESKAGAVDPHLGLPWIGSEDGLLQIVDESSRLWIVVEERYASPYQSILGDQLTTAFHELDTVVYLIQETP